MPGQVCSYQLATGSDITEAPPCKSVLSLPGDLTNPDTLYRLYMVSTGILYMVSGVCCCCFLVQISLMVKHSMRF